MKTLPFLPTYPGVNSRYIWSFLKGGMLSHFSLLCVLISGCFGQKLTVPPEWEESQLPTTGVPLGMGLSPQAAQKAKALALYFDGLTLARKKDAAGSIARFLAVLRLDPKNIGLVKRLAETYAMAGQENDALSLLEDCLRKNATVPEAYLQLSDFCYRYHNGSAALRASALQYAQQALNKFPTNGRVLSHLISLLLQESRKRDAEVVLQKTMGQPIKDAQWWIGAGHLARQVWRIGDPEGRERINGAFAKALRLAPDDPSILSSAADFYSLTSQTIEAVPLYQKLVELRPDDLRNRQKLAHALGAVQRPDEAITAWKALLEIDPRHVDAHEALTRYAEKAGDTKLAFYHRAQRLKLADAPLRQQLQLAEEMLATKMMAREALTVMERAEFLHPEAFDPLRLAAQAHLQLGEPQAALADLARAARLIEEGALRQVAMDDFYFDYANAYVAAGETKQAEENFRLSVKSTPTTDPKRAAKAYHGLASLWLNTGEHVDEALLLMQRATGYEPTNANFALTTGQLYLKKGDKAKALEVWKKADATQPSPELKAAIQQAEPLPTASPAPASPGK